MPERDDIVLMTDAFYISGRRPGLFSSLARTAFLVLAAIGGLFMLLASAAFALFAVVAVAVIGFLVFGFFWTKAKITGKPFGPRAQFEQMKKDMEAQLGNGPHSGFSSHSKEQGPVVDARRTPDGWSVDD